MTYDIVLFTDIGSEWLGYRGLGAYKIAHEARLIGYSVLVVDYCSSITFDIFKNIITKSVGDNTKCVGFSNNWFPYRILNGSNYLVRKEHYAVRGDFDSTLPADFANYDNQKYVDFIKSVNPKIDCVIGGTKTVEYLRDTCWDKIFLGYSENHFIDYLNGREQHIYNYDIKAKNGNFNFSASTVQYQETDCLMPEDSLSIEISRGCIFNCAFCGFPHRNQNTKEYTKYQDVLYKELKDNYDQWGIYKYYITDDTFNDYTPKLELVNEVIQSLDFKPIFDGYVRMDIIAKQKHQAKLLYDIGLRQVFYGLETWSDKTSKIIKKGGSKEHKIEGLKTCRDAWGDEVFIRVGCIAGLPEDTEKDFLDFMDWYETEGNKYIDNVVVNPYINRNMPGTIFTSEIENNPKKYNYTVSGMLDWTRNDSGDIDTYEKALKFSAYMNSRLAKTNKQNKNWNERELWDTYCKDAADPVSHFFKHYYYPNLLKHLDKKTN